MYFCSTLDALETCRVHRYECGGKLTLNAAYSGCAVYLDTSVLRNISRRFCMKLNSQNEARPLAHKGQLVVANGWSLLSRASAASERPKLPD